MGDAQASRRPLRIGTRGSALARWQAEWVAKRLAERGQPAQLVEITTRGDATAALPLAAMTGTGLFTKAIQRALAASEVDVAVHSLKDLPTDSAPGLTLAAVPPRESPVDALVVGTGSRANGSESLATLAAGALVATGSLRRQAQLRNVRPDLRVVEVRGNVDTRLRKLDERQFDALVLAHAGLVRLNLAGRIAQLLAPPAMLPAVGQGALAIECRADDHTAAATLAPLDDRPTRLAVTAERAMLAHLRGGCLAPVGAWGRFEQGKLRLTAAVLSRDGRQRLDAADAIQPAGDSTDATAAEALGRRVAEALLSRGAAQLIADSRQAGVGR